LLLPRLGSRNVENFFFFFCFFFSLPPTPATTTTGALFSHDDDDDDDDDGLVEVLKRPMMHLYLYVMMCGISSLSLITKTLPFVFVLCLWKK
jgi:hypothetical protein